MRFRLLKSSILKTYRVVSGCGREAAGGGNVARAHVRHYLLFVEAVAMFHEVHGGQAPIHSIDSQEFRHDVIILLLLVPVLFDEVRMLGQQKILWSIAGNFAILS